MKTTYLFLGIIAIFMYIGALAQRDKEMFKAYDQICAEQPHNSKCKYSK